MIDVTFAVPHFPGALTDCAASVLATVSRLGVWMPAPRDLNFDQLRALLALRNAGYVEYASYGGYKVRGNQYATMQAKPPQPVTAETVRAILAEHGITPVGKVLPCKDARAWRAQCWAFEYGGLLPDAARAAFVRVGRFERVYIVELRDCPNGREG